jgi:hypothetical protein
LNFFLILVLGFVRLGSGLVFSKQAAEKLGGPCYGLLSPKAPVRGEFFTSAFAEKVLQKGFLARR